MKKPQIRLPFIANHLSASEAPHRNDHRNYFHFAARFISIFYNDDPNLIRVQEDANTIKWRPLRYKRKMTEPISSRYVDRTSLRREPLHAQLIGRRHRTTVVREQLPSIIAAEKEIIEKCFYFIHRLGIYRNVILSLFANQNKSANTFGKE